MSTRLPVNLIRQQCDGELSAEQAAELEAHLQAHPEHARAAKGSLEFERTLRDRVGKVMNEPKAAPWEVRSRVQLAMQHEGDSSASKSPAARRRSLFAGGGPRANVFAVAATLALVAGAVLFGIFGRTIDEVPTLPTADLVADMAMAAGQEHDDCAKNVELFQSKTPFRSMTEAETKLTSALGAPVHVADLSKLGYEFCGGGPCKLPADVTSTHLLYRKASPDGRSPMVSVFVFPNKRDCGQKLCDGQPCGEWTVAKEPCSRCRHRVLRSTDGTLVYLLVCCVDKDADTVADLVAGAFHGESGHEEHDPG